MTFDAEFDAAFSNAALHWMLDKERVAQATFRALKPGGRYAGEMGGDGNLAKLRETLDAELVARGYPPPLESSNWYPSVEEFAAVYEAAGFIEVDARLIERPTPMPNGIGQWVTHSAAAGSTAPACPKRSAPRSARPSPTPSAHRKPTMSDFASS